MKGWMGKFRALSLLGLLALVLTGCGRENLTALKPKGYGAQTSYDLIILTTVVMSIVLLVVAIVYITVLVRFRKKKGKENFIPKQVEGNKVLETIWTVIPIVLLIIIAVPTTIATFDLADTKGAKDKLNVEVTGNQYWWHFNYKGQEIQTSQDLYIPTGEKVYLNMKSSDVIHSFWVPSLAGKMDVNPENENTMYIKADEEGVYWGKCAELCGPSHSLMDFKIVAVSPDEFDQWVNDMQGVDPKAVAEGDTAKEGQELFNEKNCMSCHAIGSSPVQVGPNLTDFGNRSKVAGIMDHNKENVVKWIMDPESVKPGNKMTNNYPELSDEEASKIADYLMQLNPSEVTLESAGD
ncbi:cytochrome c oxidase subunit II [Virgibacillus dakarensis]|uniref:Cytochrome c oxidase subunit 2 n=1 Tax=Lentibacillus populi TaxID=1827502 RepID=A0A9W5X5R7_9BACI|nr:MULTISPECIES: cytochrome c oxidase subunit II [Bacillaceae]MBT2216163.1 cytochrome c oxidase subunit II [Virgibacillus dakarensis]MTW85375.1 cytochrome c oxidase subunit II [Virgibacillus dakarensis]GGB44892.1 cytochrome c oxidase subunit 2 [Lentibacillus populi]